MGTVVVQYRNVSGNHASVKIGTSPGESITQSAPAGGYVEGPLAYEAFYRRHGFVRVDPAASPPPSAESSDASEPGGGGDTPPPAPDGAASAPPADSTEADAADAGSPGEGVETPLDVPEGAVTVPSGDDAPKKKRKRKGG